MRRDEAETYSRDKLLVLQHRLELRLHLHLKFILGHLFSGKDLLGFHLVSARLETGWTKEDGGGEHAERWKKWEAGSVQCGSSFVRRSEGKLRRTRYQTSHPKLWQWLGWYR
jgi:hypothetical protein